MEETIENICPVHDLWEGYRVSGRFQEETLTLLTRINFLRPIKERRTVFQLFKEMKAITKERNKYKLVRKLLDSQIL